MSVMDWSDSSDAPTVTHRSIYSHETPERTITQRREALEQANKIRTYRARLKRDIKAGRKSVHDLLLEPPEMIETMKVFDLILAAPAYGRTKVNKVLVHSRISPSKTIGGLTPRQRTEIVSMLRR